MDVILVMIRQPNGVYAAHVRTSMVIDGKAQLGPNVLNNPKKVPKCRSIETARTWAEITLRQQFKGIDLRFAFEEADACPAT